ncbi:MAG: universal stress protein [Candidatus Thorarchaeota archaeon]
MKIYKKILIGTDGSHDANNAADRAAELQKEWKSDIVIFHSINHHKLLKTIYPETTLPLEVIQNIEDLSRKAGKEILKKTELVFDKSLSLVETRLIEDLSPEDYILKAVNHENFDLVVIGSKGHHSKIKHIFHGTISTHILREAPCDVLIVR